MGSQRFTTQAFRRVILTRKFLYFYFRMCQMPQVRSCLVIVLVLSSLCAIVVQTQPMTKTSIDGSTSTFRTSQYQNNKQPLEETESLPPDTFRKLAQALYQNAVSKLDRKKF